MRRVLGWSSALLVLALGLVTAGLVAENRRRGSRLDELQRWCEATVRKNELQRTRNARAEWSLLDRDPVLAARGSEADP
jgi:hypothetical protein